MKDLNQHQLILLVLLISFVTSIGTGIITASLLEEVPPTITSTVNRVVEKTIETIVEIPAGGKGEETVREVTVVVNQEDLVTESIEKNSKSIVRIFKTIALGPEQFYGIGIITNNGIISYNSPISSTDVDYRVEFESGVSVSANRISLEGVNKISLFKVVDNSLDFGKVILGDANSLKLGQTLIVVGGQSQNIVSIGTLSSVDKKTEGEAIIPVNLNIAIDERDSVGGAPIINLKGDVVGIRTVEILADGTPRKSHVPINLVKSELSQIR